jgi:ribosomal protein S18 acetylase RimI-like enzyme
LNKNMADDRQFETYFAETPDKLGVELGRGDTTDPDSNVHNAFASIPTTGELHQAIVSNLDAASDGEPITVANGAQVLARAVMLANEADTASLPTTDLSEPIIVPFKSGESADFYTGRVGFWVRRPDSKGSYARCWEGYTLNAVDYPEPEDEVIEPHVVDISMVGVEENEAGNGIGTSLVLAGLAEAVRRGFRYARATVENPKIVHIFTKLEQQEIITASKFGKFPKDSRPVPTEEIIEQKEPVSNQDVLHYLQSLPQGSDGWVIGGYDRVEVVLELT